MKEGHMEPARPNSQAFCSSNLGPSPNLSRVVTAIKQKISLGSHLALILAPPSLPSPLPGVGEVGDSFQPTLRKV